MTWQPMTARRSMKLVGAPNAGTMTTSSSLRSSYSSFISRQGRETLRRKQSLTDEQHETSHLAILENLPPIREFIRRASINMSLSEDITFAFKIAVDEACTNIIQHGYKGLKPGPIKLIFERDPGRVTLTLYDKGISFNPENAVEADINADWKQRQIGGLGLHMVKEMIDEIQYDSTSERGNCLKLIKNINL